MLYVKAKHVFSSKNGTNQRYRKKIKENLGNIDATHNIIWVDRLESEKSHYTWSRSNIDDQCRIQQGILL